MINIVQMELKHIDMVAQISAECFSLPWTREQYLSELKNKNARTLVSITDNMVIGFINALFVLDEGYINNIAVTEGYRKSGIGSRLLEELVNIAKAESMSFLTLEVRESNVSAIKFYEKHGFAKMGVRKNFYQNPTENGAIYTMELQ